jgi:hypothetical protein
MVSLMLELFESAPVMETLTERIVMVCEPTVTTCVDKVKTRELTVMMLLSVIFVQFEALAVQAKMAPQGRD